MTLKESVDRAKINKFFFFVLKNTTVSFLGKMTVAFAIGFDGM